MVLRNNADAVVSCYGDFGREAFMCTCMGFSSSIFWGKKKMKRVGRVRYSTRRE